jgi:hypothetical protein
MYHTPRLKSDATNIVLCFMYNYLKFMLYYYKINVIDIINDDC